LGEDALGAGAGFRICGGVLLFVVGLVVRFACGLRSLGPSSLCTPGARRMRIGFCLFSAASIIFVHACFLFSSPSIRLIFFFFSPKTTLTSFGRYLLAEDSFMKLYLVLQLV
jgi:hypothetical protein